MPRSGRLKTGIAAAILAAVCWLLIGTIQVVEYRIDARALSGWTLVRNDPGNTAVVSLRPPSDLPARLRDQLQRQSPQPLAAPPQPAMPLVLQREYEDSLQGVASVDDVMNVARDAGVESARFDPVCIARHAQAAGAVYFVRFESAVFDEFRRRLTPAFPEHGGMTPYDAKTLQPVLVIGASDPELAGRWPDGADQPGDCQARLRLD